MFLFDSMVTSGLRWLLATLHEAASAELDDDKPLREALLAAGVQLELGEISEGEFAQIEEDILARINEIRGRRESAGGPITMTGSASAPQVDAAVVGDFHEVPAKPAPAHPRRRARSARSQP